MISPDKFYGEITISQRKIEAKLKKTPVKKKITEPVFISSLLGPSHTWKIFRKQQDALNFSNERRSGLMAFAFENAAGERSFLVCHPIYFWYQNSHREDKDKCTYEIIQENTKCKLYLDIEFEYEFNQGVSFQHGEEMLETFIKVLQGFLVNELDIECHDDWFLDLDSSTASKFSRHVILNIPDCAFSNNLSVGNVAKAVCSKITDHLLNENEKEMYKVPRQNIEKLVITDRKGLKKLFIDQCVYTRNRHFRLLGSTKAHKNAPLIVSDRNKFQPSSKEDHAMFLASLITYFDKTDLKIIQYGQQTVKERQISQQVSRQISSTAASSFDDFINSIISPHGKIRQKIDKGNAIKYEIANYRFCANIGREHKSNNISLIVDIERLEIYQTCYDPECKGYSSERRPLPQELCFLDDDPIVADFDLVDADISDEQLLMIADATEGLELMQ